MTSYIQKVSIPKVSYFNAKERADEGLESLLKPCCCSLTTFDYPIVNVVFNPPATIVFWFDGSKTVVKCMDGDTWDPEKGLAMAISKKILGEDFHKVFKKWTSKK